MPAPFRRAQEDFLHQKIDRERARRKRCSEPKAADHSAAIKLHRKRGMSEASLKRIYGANVVMAALEPKRDQK